MIPANFNLEGKVAIVAGDGRGWLGAIASYLAEAGASVVMVDEDSDKLARIAQTMQEQGQRITFALSCITDQREVDRTIDEIISKWGNVDILINNMCFQFAKPLLDTTYDEWNRTLAQNLTGVFLWSKAVGKHMLRKRQGSIINISSILAERGLSNSTAFCASCGGVSQFTRALALEWSTYNIRVNAIGIGWTTPQNHKKNEAEARLERYISIGRFCQPDDIAAILVYLASLASSYVTGQTYFVSGGVMSHG